MNCKWTKYVGVCHGKPAGAPWNAPTRLIAVAMALILSVSGLGAQSDGVTIHTPVDGDFATIGNDKIHILNSFTGDVTNFSDTSAFYSSSLSWNTNGTNILYWDQSYDLTWYDVENQILEHRSLPTVDIFFDPIGWSADDTEVLVLSVSEVTQYPSRNLTFYDYDISNKQLDSLLSYVAYSSSNDIPNPLGETPYNFGAIDQLVLNPVFDEWIIGNYYSQNNESNIIIHNLISGQMIQLNPMLQNQRIWDYVWNTSGNELLVWTQDNTYHSFQFHVFTFDASGTLEIKQSFDTGSDDEDYIEDFIGVDDIFITSSSNSGIHSYSLNQIINGQLYQQPFFDVDSSVYDFKKGVSDFYLRADDQEKHQLSCLFDQAQTTQFSIGARGQALTALTLYTEPDFASAELTQISEGTEFDIIGGSACINAESYYRLWQIELDDGTIGWAIEADLDGYFMAVSDDE